MYADTFEEGKMPAGLQAYLDKKKGKKKDDDNGDDEKEGKKKAKKDVKEGAGLYANIHAKRKRGGKMRKKGAKGAPSSQDFANAAKTAKEDVDLFDLVSTKLLEEGYDEKDVYKVMSNLTEEQLNEFIVTGTLAALAAKGALAGKAAAAALAAKGGAALAAGKGAALAAGKGALAAGKGALTAVKGAGKGIASAGKNVGSTVKGAASEFKKGMMTKPTSTPKITGDVMKSAPKSTPVSKAQKAGQVARKVGAYAKNNPLETMYVANTVTSAGGGSQQQASNTISKTGRRTSVTSSADLFDIVKGQLLDEGLSEEEIRDIMLELTPEEILNEISFTKVGKYMSDASKDLVATSDSLKKSKTFGGDDPRLKRLQNRGAGLKRAGKEMDRQLNNPSGVNTEEYKNFDPKKPNPKQMEVQAKQEKAKQKFNDPHGVKNRNIGGQGLDPMDK